MILGLMGVGFLSAFAVGPASFNIIRTLIAKRTWPWSSIGGFLLGDLIYILLALLLIQSPLLQELWLKSLLTILTVICLVLYSGKVLLTTKPAENEATVLIQGFRKNLLLTLSNFHLLFIYAGLFVGFSGDTSDPLWMGVLVYILTFLLSFFIMLFALLFFQKSLKTTLRKIEVLAAFGFITFSVYLSLGML